MGANAGSPPQGLAADLEEALVVYEGTIESGSNQTIFTCINLSGYPNYEGNQVIFDPPYGGHGQARQIVGDTSNGTVILDAPLSSTPGAGATFKITGIRVTPANVSIIQGYTVSILANESIIIQNQSNIYVAENDIWNRIGDALANQSVIYGANLTYWASITTNETAIYNEVTSLDLNQTAIFQELESLDINQTAIIGNQTQLYSEFYTLNVSYAWTQSDGTEQILFNLTGLTSYYFEGGNINLSNVSTNSTTDAIFLLKVYKMLYTGHDFVPSTYSNITYSEIYNYPIVEVDGFPNIYGAKVTLQQLNNSNVSIFSEWYYVY